ncbi:hypothetical protein BJV78DRAFT_1286116 [Lactifluus subvellereus]|nr:hypothetical protein BJV78DRAFT_1286116 [Lactifluus subvellereus]
MAANLLTSVHDVLMPTIGGGTAGLVVDTRLSQDSTVSVLILEAGRANLNDNSINARSDVRYVWKTFFRLDYDWRFMTVPQKHNHDTAFYWPRELRREGPWGLIFYVFTQPPASDIDAIEKLGNPGWNWDTYLRYSRKSERFAPPSAQEAAAERLHFDPAHHGTDVPISTCYSPLRSGWDSLYQDTLGKLGLPPARDATQGDGNAAWMATCSVNPEILRGALDLDRDLTLVCAGSRTPQCFSGVLKNASGDLIGSGVEFVHEGKTYTGCAKREVILSAGAIKTPQILEFSGIGNPEILAKVGVTPRVDLPNVGENVQEHIFTALAFAQRSRNYNTQDPIADEAVLKEQLRLYTEHKGLFLLSFLGIGTGSLARLSPDGAALTASHAARIHATPAETRPGIAEQYALQLDKLSAGTASLEMVSMSMYLSRPNLPEPGKKFITIVSILNHSWSCGAIAIHAGSADPLAGRGCTDGLRQICKTWPSWWSLVRRLCKTSPLGDIIAREHNLGPEVQTDEELIAWIKQYTNSIAHTSGMCSMLLRDKGGVVNRRLKAYGTHNLRVVDLSILPLHIGAPTQTEQAADIIKGII